MKVILNFLLGLALAIAIGIFAYVVFVRSGEYVKVEQDKFSLDIQKVKNEAIDGCFKSATVTNSGAGATKIEPSMYIYDLCLKDKGFQSTPETK